MRSAVFPIVKREYLQRVRSRWFVIATIAGPLLFVGIAVLPILSAGSSDPGEIVVVDRTGELLPVVGPALQGAGYVVTSAGTAAAVADASIESYVQQIHDDEIFGVLVLDSATLARGR